LPDRKLETTTASPPNVEASINPKVEQLAHALGITLIVVPATADLLILHFKSLIICKLKFTKTATRIELIQVKKILQAYHLEHRMLKKVRKIEYSQKCLLLSKKQGLILSL
jgi:hypothetical protein